MALAGEGAICIWNDVTPESEIDFYAWHAQEHMPERVGIPGFLRGRRYIRADNETTPQFFTLYETITPEVASGQDYLNRLNAPTPWTVRCTKEFRNTFRALTRVRASLGPGSGGALTTLRMTLDDADRDAIERVASSDLLSPLGHDPMITGAHFCMTNMAASAGRTAETKDRDDIQEPPNTVILIEGANIEATGRAMAAVVKNSAMAAQTNAIAGQYILEYTRNKTAHAPG